MAIDKAERIANRALCGTVGIDEAVGRRAPGTHHALVDHVTTTHEPLKGRHMIWMHERSQGGWEVRHRDSQSTESCFEVCQEDVLRCRGDTESKAQWQAYFKEGNVKARRGQLQQPRCTRVRKQTLP